VIINQRHDDDNHNDDDKCVRTVCGVLLSVNLLQQRERKACEFSLLSRISSGFQLELLLKRCEICQLTKQLLRLLTDQKPQVGSSS